MVMKRNAMRTNLRQSILRSLGRYIAIATIIALGASIFVGLRMTKADMVATGQAYMDEQNMFDLRLATSYGWDQDQLAQVAQLEGVDQAEGGFYMDLIVRQEAKKDAEDQVFRVHSIPQSLNQVQLRHGRMPENPDECLADVFFNDESVLGTKILVSEANDEDNLEALTRREFTVVGLASSPLYMDMNRGNTSVGSGTIENFLYVPEEAFDVDYYTEIYLTLPGDYAIYSEAYNDAMDQAADSLEPELERLAQQRLEQVRQEAEDAYADGMEEYEDGLKSFYDGTHEAYEELKDGYWELIDAEQEIADNEQSLLDGEDALDDARITIQESKIALQTGRQTLADAKSEAYGQLNASSMELLEQIQNLSMDSQTLTDQLLQINASLVDVNAAILPLETELAMIDASIAQTESQIDMVDLTISMTDQSIAWEQAKEQPDADRIAQLEQQKQEALDRRAELEAQLAEQQAQREACLAELAPYYAQKEDLERQQSELEAERQALEDSIAALTEQMVQLAAQQVLMENEFVAAEAQLESGEAQLEAAEAQLVLQEELIAQGWEALEEGRQELADGWQEYRDGKEEAEQELADGRTELADARAELADARETIDAMTDPGLHVLDRTSNVGYTSLDSSSDIVAGVSKVFPMFFLLVAALVCITTMTRMVDEERTQIGTLKALGYSNRAIISKYMLYAGSSAILGCGMGVVVGSVVFPAILWEAYKIMLCITDRIVLTFDLGLCLTVVASYTLVELAVTWYCCYRTLDEVPAELIRPKAPDAGKQLLFEKLPGWKKVSFLNKVTIRNIFRYHQRLAMMLVGIGGCTALLVTGFGLKDSIVNIANFQYEDITTYDIQVYFSEGLTEADQEAFSEDVEEYISDIAFYHQSSATLVTEDQTRDIYLIASDGEIQRFINFNNGSQALSMPGVNEVLLSVGVAEALGIQEGDTITLRDLDLQTMELKVCGIYDNYVYNYAVVLPETIAANWGTEPETQMAMVSVGEGQDVHKASAEITSLDSVINVSVSDDLASMVSGMMDALNLVVVVIVICAGLLAATVLYNLTNININERIREIATIKVLGFNAVETAMYIFKENLALTGMGMAVGLVFGKLLLDFVISQIKIDFVWFQARALPPSYLWSALLTILMAVLVDFIFYFKLEKVNMAEALKSVE